MLFRSSLFLQFLQEGQQERHRDAEGEAIGDGLAQLNAAQMDRVSVPMWGTFLSEPLSIEGLVGRYPANNLMERIPIDDRNSLIVPPCGRTMPSGINLSFERLSPSHRQVGYVLLTRAPVAIKLSKLSSCCPSTCMC